jgi:hypothetical protein
LHNVNLTLLWVSEHNAVYSWQVDALGKASCIGHERAIEAFELPQQIATLPRCLLARDLLFVALYHAIGLERLAVLENDRQH